MRRPLAVIASAGILATVWLAAPTGRVLGKEAEAEPAAEAPAPTPEATAPTPEAPAGASEAPAWDRRVSELVSPGPLARAHAALEGVTRCNECHTWLGGTPDSSCLGCHEDVGERMARGAGHHGRLEGRCSGCHADHRGVDVDLLGLDREGFAHDQALFALRGAHADVACDDCHVRAHPETGREAFHPIGAPSDCVGCHASPHAERLVRERDCESCHTAAGWSAPAPAGAEGFDHGADTRFVLDAVHARLDCAACHGEALEPPPARDCATCHPDAAALLAGRFDGRQVAPDPHAGTTECRQCHPAAMARPSLAEYAAVCLECHPASYAPLLATRRALLDEAWVAARLATRGPADRRRLERLARSGLHHSELAEALALEMSRASSP